MASQEGKETLHHFTHPHVLIKAALDQTPGYENYRFRCDACFTVGSGTMYYCKQCNFGLHEVCATCPEYHTSDLHPEHQLERIWEGTENDCPELRPCGVCGYQVKGLFYKCSYGAADGDGQHCFFIHLSCSKLPTQVLLKLQPVPVNLGSRCAVCRKPISSSTCSYRSDLSGLNMHPQCVTPPCDNYNQYVSLPPPVCCNINQCGVVQGQ